MLKLFFCQLQHLFRCKRLSLLKLNKVQTSKLVFKYLLIKLNDLLLTFLKQLLKVLTALVVNTQIFLFKKK